MEWLTNSHVRRGDYAALGHEHRRVVSHRFQFCQTEGSQRYECFHSLFFRFYENLYRVELDPVSGEKLLQVLSDGVRQFVNVFIHFFQRCRLNYLVDGLLHDGPA